MRVRLWHLRVYSCSSLKERWLQNLQASSGGDEFFAIFMSQDSVVTFCLGERHGLSWKSGVKELLSWKILCHMPILTSAVFASCPVSCLVYLRLLLFVDAQWILHFSTFFHCRESGNSIQVKAGLLTHASSVRAALAAASIHQSCFATSKLSDFHEAWIKCQPMHHWAAVRISSLLIAPQSTLGSLAAIENETLTQSLSKASTIPSGISKL